MDECASDFQSSKLMLLSSKKSWLFIVDLSTYASDGLSFILFSGS